MVPRALCDTKGLGLCCGWRGLLGGIRLGSSKGLLGGFRTLLQATRSKMSIIYVMPENSLETNGLQKTYWKLRNDTCSNTPLESLVGGPRWYRVTAGKGTRLRRDCLGLPGRPGWGVSIKGSRGAVELSTKPLASMTNHLRHALKVLLELMDFRTFLETFGITPARVPHSNR